MFLGHIMRFSSAIYLVLHQHRRLVGESRDFETFQVYICTYHVNSHSSNAIRYARSLKL
jgi:hypothetical protein